MHEDDVVHLLAEVQRRYQQHGDRDAAGKARQRRQHDEHEHDARRPQQPGAGEQHALQHAGDQRREQDAAQQGLAAVFFLHGRAHHQQQQHVVQKVLPPGVAQHMAEQPDVEQRVLERRAVDAEQVHGGPAAGPVVEEQHQKRQQKKGEDHRGVVLKLQLESCLFRNDTILSLL